MARLFDKYNPKKGLKQEYIFNSPMAVSFACGYYRALNPTICTLFKTITVAKTSQICDTIQNAFQVNQIFCPSN